jgi:hypothetical protein
MLVYICEQPHESQSGLNACAEGQGLFIVVEKEARQRVRRLVNNMRCRGDLYYIVYPLLSHIIAILYRDTLLFTRGSGLAEWPQWVFGRIRRVGKIGLRPPG